MIRAFISLYLPSYPTTLVYMLQSTEYQIKPYLQWLSRTKDFTQVTQRRTLDPTKAARLLLLAVRIGIVLHLVLAVVLIYLGLRDTLAGGVLFGIALALVYPFVWAYVLVVPLLFGCWLVSGPAEQRLIANSEQIFARHSGIKIAVAGSYGKTTMKELLKTVLSEGLNVAATPANKNVSSSHARFAAKLKGDEDVLIIEYGEGQPGDVARFASITHPTHAIVTGVAPAHLDQYKTVTAAGEDIMSVANYVDAEHLYVNAESPDLLPFIKPNYNAFDIHGTLGWKTKDIKTSLQGTSFTLQKGKQKLQLHSGLLGTHHIGFLSLVAALALEFGLTKEQVKAALTKTAPFEHRMQPYQLNGAWIIDDTYNGNLEGIRAGTQLLATLDAKRKLYVTPGLVDQGADTETIHIEVGKLIAAAKPDIVVLMQNSVTNFIEQGLEQAKFQGEIRIEKQPLEFYTNLNHLVASGDVILMQNDWTDNYA